MLHDEFIYFINNQDELVRKHRGKYIVIKDRRVIGEYASEWAAYTESQKQHELGTFLIQKCEPGPAAYTVVLRPATVSA